MKPIVATLVVCAHAAAAHAQCIEAPAEVSISDAYDCNPVEVYWVEVAGAIDYIIERAPQADLNDIMVVGNEAGSPFYDYDAEFDVPYYYWVTAVAPCGQSNAAGPAPGTRWTNVFPPAWVSASDNQYCDLIVVDWDVSAWAPNYFIYRSEVNDFATAMNVGDISFPPFEDYAVAGNVGYSYWVVATTDCGQSPPAGPDIGFSNYGLYLYDGPYDTTVESGEAAVFHVDTSPFAAYEWYGPNGRLDDGGNISGAYTDTLTIDPATASDAGWYSCSIAGGCGNIESPWAYLFVDSSGICRADLAGSSDPNDPGYGVPDGTLDASDFFYYLDQFVDGNLGVADLTGSSDPNNPVYGSPDGAIDASDFFYFLDLFVEGCP